MKFNKIKIKNIFSPNYSRRKKSSSSRASKTNTRIEIEKNGNSIPNAKTELQSLIGIEDETFKNYYIKQDSIRAIINEKPEEQSRGIEQVLGTAEIREFIDALNKKTDFSKINFISPWNFFLIKNLKIQ